MWFTVYFLINSVWVSGDIAYPDGWSSRYYEPSVCIESARKANINFQASEETKNIVKAECDIRTHNGWQLISR